MGIEGWSADALGYLHPADEAEVSAIVRAADGRPVRVRGAAHSVPGAIHTGPRLEGRRHDGIDLVLDRLDGVSLDGTIVTVGAGVRLGPDPRDPHRRPGLCAWLHARGLALINVGGVLHQTVAGFLMTGSCGGSTTEDVSASVVGLRLVDGRGEVHDVGEDDPRLPGLRVSLGLCGVVTEVRLRCVPAFFLAGREDVVGEVGPTFDLYADGPTGVAAFLRRHRFARLLWWPQAEVRRVVRWRADPAPDGPVVRYRPMPPVLGSSLPVQAGAGLALRAISGWRGLSRRLVGVRATGALASSVGRVVKGPVYRAFVGEPATAAFSGPWHEVLPMDQEMDEGLLPTTFTEVFVPLRLAHTALRALRDLRERTGDAAVGRFAIELYAAPASEAWLSPAFGEAQLRINVFWLEVAGQDPRDTFFPRLWAALAPFGPRLHWGKLLPWVPSDAGLAARYPRLPELLRLRAQLDPDDLFFTPYWRAALGESLGRPAAPMPEGRMFDRLKQAAWPSPFRLRPSDEGTLDRADHVFDLAGTFKAPPEAVLASLWSGEAGNAPGLLRWVWHTEAGELDGAAFDEHFNFMTIGMHVVDYVPGRRLVVSVDRCTWPLGQEMVQVCELEPTAEGCRMRWRIATVYVPGTAALAPVLVPAFRLLFETMMRRLEARFN